MPSQYYVAPYNGTLAYKQHDVVYGIESAANASPYFYATQDVSAGGYSPSGVYAYAISQYSRADDVTTLTYDHTGGLPFAPGSIIKVQGVSENSTVNFTGMVMAGGSGTVSYINPGWAQTQAVGSATISCLCPGWTTGFYWVPTYTSKIPTDNNTTTVRLGDGYVQSSPNGLNSFNQNPTFVYRDIGGRQLKAMTIFVQDHAGASTFEVLFNDPFINNQPNQKFAAASIDDEPASFGLYNVNVQLARRFDL